MLIMHTKYKSIRYSTFESLSLWYMWRYLSCCHHGSGLWVHPVHLMNAVQCTEYRLSARRLPTLRSSQTTGLRVRRKLTATVHIHHRHFTNDINGRWIEIAVVYRRTLTVTSVRRLELATLLHWWWVAWRYIYSAGSGWIWFIFTSKYDIWLQQFQWFFWESTCQTGAPVICTIRQQKKNTPADFFQEASCFQLSME